jgi:outer membrane protein OmpA-like peptidoglycan-associated protein
MKKLVAILLALALLCGLAGCGAGDASQSADPYNVALVVAIANNNPVLDTSAIEALTQLPSAPNSTYSVILADGAPYNICQDSNTIPDMSDRGYTSEMMNRIQASISADLASQISSAQPNSPEVDLAAATTLAVRSLRANAVEGRENLLVFYASGISTTGLIDMTEIPLCELDVEASVATLSANSDLDLSGIKVIWYCCGDVTDPQPALNAQEKSTLKSFYQDWLLSLGAESVTFMDTLPPEGRYSFDQSVSVMETAGTVSGLQATIVSYEEIAEEDSQKVIEKALGDGNILSFDPTTIAFQPDSSELADPDAALVALGYVTDYMLANPTFQLLICGTTTSAGEETSSIAFSQKRADAVRDLLVNEAGIDASRIHTLGCGYSSSLYVPDRAADGSLDETIAPQNRSVYLVDSESEAAAQILSSLDPS